MILIFSNNQEITTNEVIKWLIALGKPFIRVHEDEFFEIKVINRKIFLSSESNNFFIDDISSVWYRRGGLNFKCFNYENEAVNTHMQEVQFWLEDYVYKTLESRKHINKQSNASVNKLIVLQKAVALGLNVPNYFLAENTDDVVLNKTITKSFSEDMYLVKIFENVNAIGYTSVIAEKTKKDFYPTFFQEKVEKDFEIRCFYLDGKIWSIAIMSQNDDQTKTDFRKYNKTKPNRNVRYNLPKEVGNKLDLLMKSVDLNCGSIDLIKSGKEFYFLEINPVGQFTGVSFKCNYNLEKEIAMYL